jgi:twitching motility protein PilT
MSNFEAQIDAAATPKEKSAIIQKILGTLTKGSLEDYRLLQRTVDGDFGNALKGFGQKCIGFADKKFPNLKTDLQVKTKKEIESLVKPAEDLPDNKACKFCLQTIPYTALKCFHCVEFVKVEKVRVIENTYPITAHELYKKANKLGTSDIHLAVGFHPIFRISGTMTHMKEMPILTDKNCMSLAYQTLSDDSKRIFEVNKEVDQAFDIEGVCRLRLNVAEERRGVMVVARILPSEILSMDDLKFRNQEVFVKLCQEVNGLILVTGPTGSGKSTTLAAMIDYINTNRQEHIITIEDPVEFVHQPKQSKIMQRELRTSTLSFGNALKSALRQDPDIMLVGELRDLETTELALEAAETGHLVFGTLHTNSAAKTIDRIINMFPSEDQDKVRTALAENLKGIIAQQLIKKVGGGRVAPQEIMLKSLAISALIREKKTYQINEYIRQGSRIGMQTMDDTIKIMLEEGSITPLNAFRYALNKTDFAYTDEQKLALKQ